MTTKVPFTKHQVVRAVEAVRAAGVEVGAVTFGADGSFTVFHGKPIVAPVPKMEKDDPFAGRFGNVRRS